MVEVFVVKGLKRYTRPCSTGEKCMVQWCGTAETAIPHVNETCQSLLTREPTLAAVTDEH